MTGHGLILAAPASGSGKTTVTLALLRALRRRGIAVRGAKSGPDYIDPRYHEAACGAPSLNLDAWAMPDALLRALAGGDDLLLIEGAMGLFDGAPPDGRGATADLARLLRLPVVLVVDAGRMAQSIAPIVQGFARHDPAVRMAGVILNRVGSDRHARMLLAALAPLGLPVLGAIPRDAALSLPSRHLGLVQAAEHPALDSFLNNAADMVERHLDITKLTQLAASLPEGQYPTSPWGAGFAGRIAIARDAAFSFTYPHQAAAWEAAGARIAWFSPLADERVPPADLVFLPGGYPELHAATLSAADRFRASLRETARTTPIYGECGGYMVLGDTLTDADGDTHPMTGLLPLETSFAERRLSLGYRDVAVAVPGLPLTGRYKAHEFHYATVLRADGPFLFHASDAEGTTLPGMGLVRGLVSGSFAHLIAPA